MSGSDSIREYSMIEFLQLSQPSRRVQSEYSAPAVQFPAGGESALVVAAAAAAAPGGSLSEPPLKRKRGRPRKNPITTITTTPTPTLAISQSGGSLALSAQPGAASAGGASGKKPRGRPRGSRNKKREPEVPLVIPDVLIVKAGEDVAAKIMDYSQSAPRNIFILSANGSISSATICQPSSPGGTETYEGRFEILALAGTFVAAEDGSEDSRAGDLSITLSGPDGQTFGGAVAGLLIAAAPVKVVLGSFKPVKQIDTAQPRFARGGQRSSPSLGSDSSGGL